MSLTTLAGQLQVALEYTNFVIIDWASGGKQGGVGTDKSRHEGCLG